MEFKIVPKILKLEEKVYGITIPPKNIETVYPPLVLVPLFGFHAKTKQRIGYGAGYYDQYISFTRKRSIPITFIGIASKWSEFKESAWNEHDEPLDYIVTE